MKVIKLNRRDFLKSSALAGGGLVLGVSLPLPLNKASAKEVLGHNINAFIKIGADESITIAAPGCEMGQGNYTTLPLMVAEELEVDFTKVQVVMASNLMNAKQADATFKHPYWQTQISGGSANIFFMEPLRKIGASAREMLIGAAAERWGAQAQDCFARDGMVIHRTDGRKLSYGALAESAAKLTPPQEPKLKAADQFRLIGQPIRRLDTPLKVNGSAVFGIDVEVPGMLHGAVKFSPVFGGEVAGMNETAAKAVKGVKAVVPVPSGVVVVAESYWQAERGIDALDVRFDEGDNVHLNDENLFKTFKDGLKEKGKVARSEGNAEDALASAAKTLEMEYYLPFLAQAPLEPMNATASVTADRCEIWAPTQSQGPSAWKASWITGLPLEKIQVNTTFIGGGFGRRLETDFIEMAVRASKAVGKPVKVLWSREEDMGHGFYRPAHLSTFRIGLDDQGLPVAWVNRTVGPSKLTQAGGIAQDWVKANESGMTGWPGWSALIEDGLDWLATEGTMSQQGDDVKGIPYVIPNLSVDHVMKNTPVPVGFWRAIAANRNTFFVESVMDEVAYAGGWDPYGLRRKLLAEHPRVLAVLDLAATKSGWGKALPEGRFRGIALSNHWGGTIVCQVAEVSVDQRAKVRVHRVVSAVDCGLVVNPTIVKQQIEGGIIFGLTAALKGQINIRKGQVVQKNFDDFPVLRMKEAPKMETHFVESTATSTAAGEPGVHPIAPAVANAVFAATGKRVRKLPIRPKDLV